MLAMNEQLSDRAVAQGHAFCTRDGLDCGYDQHGLSNLVLGGEVMRVRNGAYVVRAALEGASPEAAHAMRTRAVLRAVGRGFSASHHSALSLFGLPLHRADLGVVHLVRRRKGSVRRSGVVAVHAPLPPHAYCVVDRVPSIWPRFALIQHAADVGVVGGVVAADAALRERRCTAGELTEALGVLPVRYGVADARQTVELADGLSESPGESRARLLFRSLGLPGPELQAAIRDGTGAFVGRVDFLFRQQRTIVEFDGLVKYGGAKGRDALVAEKRREDRLRALGYRVVRLTWRDLDDPQRVVRMIMAAFARDVRA